MGVRSWNSTRLCRDQCEQPFHMFYLTMNSLVERQALIAHLASRGILAVLHYQPSIYRRWAAVLEANREIAR